MNKQAGLPLLLQFCLFILVIYKTIRIAVWLVFYKVLLILFMCLSKLTGSSIIKARDGGQRTTIYKRDPSKQYGLKMKTSRMFFSEVERRFDAMPFTLR